MIPPKTQLGYFFLFRLGFIRVFQFFGWIRPIYRIDAEMALNKLPGLHKILKPRPLPKGTSKLVLHRFKDGG